MRLTFISVRVDASISVAVAHVIICDFLVVNLLIERHCLLLRESLDVLVFCHFSFHQRGSARTGRIAILDNDSLRLSQRPSLIVFQVLPELHENDRKTLHTLPETI